MARGWRGTGSPVRVGGPCAPLVAPSARARHRGCLGLDPPRWSRVLRQRRTLRRGRARDARAPRLRDARDESDAVPEQAAADVLADGGRLHARCARRVGARGRACSRRCCPVFFTCRLGARLFDDVTGLARGRLPRHHVRLRARSAHAAPRRRPGGVRRWRSCCWRPRRAAELDVARRWLVAMYAASGIGVHGEGRRSGGRRRDPGRVRRFATRLAWHLGACVPLLGLAVFLLVAAPWHVAVAMRHPGFAWDYVVNQHLLFFLDKKLPRDSVGDPLTFFWSMFLGALAAVDRPGALHGARGAARLAARRELAGLRFFCWAWLAGVMLLLLAGAVAARALLAAGAAGGRAARRARAGGGSRAGAVGRLGWAWLGAIAVACSSPPAGSAPGRATLLAQRLLDQAEVPALLGRSCRPAGRSMLVGGAIWRWRCDGTRRAASMRHWRWRRRSDDGDRAPGAGRGRAVLLVAARWRASSTRRCRGRWTSCSRRPRSIRSSADSRIYTRRRITMLESPGFTPPDATSRPHREHDVPAARRVRAALDRTGAARVRHPIRNVGATRPDGLVPGPFRRPRPLGRPMAAHQPHRTRHRSAG